MTTITFANENAHGLFHSMTEGMWEVARDDNVSPAGDEGDRARLLGEVIEATPWKEGETQYPATFTLPEAIAEAARTVLANMVDNRENWENEYADDADSPDREYILDGEIVIAPGTPPKPGETIFDYFSRVLGEVPQDATLRELPVASPCGDDCSRAINAAAVLIGASEMAVGPKHRDQLLAIAAETVRVFWHG